MGNKILKCPTCGKEFERQQNAQKHCSAKCRIAWNSKKEVKAKYNIKSYICAWCGISFEADRKRKYCTDECRFITNGHKKRKSKKNVNLSEINKLAREAGLSYGQHVAKMGL